MTDLEFEYRGPKRGADRAVLLAHGAGSDMRGVALTSVADALAAAGIPALTFNFPYRSAGRRAPDRPPVLEAAARGAAAELVARSGVAPERIVLGGRSMGGRICSQVVGADEDPLRALGLVLLAYPLHPPGRPERLRVEHFPRIHVPSLFVSGTRDAFATPDELEQQTRQISGPVQFHWLDTADHGFKPLKASGHTVAGVLAEVATTVVEWLRHSF
ncbi:MAG: alpha/beta hydrolase superfamily enzyme predicted hydrolase [Actinomycetia bacterium]|nr:alpha/beta hydrolase superfamily enzyme predicted hydrolase [Actinomycetes bacterium]